MSAFICSDKQIATVVSTLEYKTDDERQKIADLIKKANIRSVNYRYGERTKITPCYMNEADPALAADKFAVITLCQSIDYQCCECRDWDGSPAFGWLHYIASQVAWGVGKNLNKAWSV